MNFFNIGAPELLLIFVIALIVVGPRRLPEIAQSLGKIVSDIRKMSQEFTVDMMREMNAPADAKENEAQKTAKKTTSEKPIQSLGEIVGEVKRIPQEFAEEITRELTVSLDPKESEARKREGRNASDKPAQGDQG